MNTIIIWDDPFDPISFITLNGDYSHLDEIYIGSEESPAKEKILDGLLYNEDGSQKVEFKKEFPHEDYKPSETHVIICGAV